MLGELSGLRLAGDGSPYHSGDSVGWHTPLSWLNAGGPKREGGEAGDESWLGGECRRGARGEADADAGRRETTASRRIRAADARHAHRGDQRYPPVPARDDRFDDRGPAVKRGRFPGRSERAGRKRADGAAAGGDGNLAIAETP